MPKTHKYKIRKIRTRTDDKGKHHYNHSLTLPLDLVERVSMEYEYECVVLPEVRLPDDEQIPEDLRGRTIKGILFMPDEPNPFLPTWLQKK